MRELDRVLAAFQGSHRFHNFGSGLRAADETPGVPRLFYVSGGESWPLGLDPRDESQATAFRSVVRSRVERTLSVGGTPYVLLRICGLSFVLHQAARSRLPAPRPAPPRPPPARRRT